jgi:protocatechuate 3,4-dioxygenase, alpha subunit
MTRRTPPTAHITTGPFFPAQFIRPEDADLARGGQVAGTAVTLLGAVTDARGSPCVNAVLEIWQAHGAGKLGLWGRTWTDKDGLYRFRTVKPGGRSPRAPYLSVTMHASGLMRPLVTQVFLPADLMNDKDPQLSLVPSPRRALLIARQESDGVLRFDIALGGANETPFFED